MDGLIGLGILAYVAGKVFEGSDKTVIRRKRGIFRNKTEIDGTCYRCGGTGRVYGKTCRKCSGTGRYHKTYYN